jgi:hypothetical protein
MYEIPKLLGLYWEVKYVLLHAMEAHEGEEVYLLLILNLGTRLGWVVRVTPRPRALPPVPIGHEAGWAPEPVWTQRLEEKSSASIGDRTPVVQLVVSHYTQSLYWLSYRGSYWGVEKYIRRMLMKSTAKLKELEILDFVHLCTP